MELSLLTMPTTKYMAICRIILNIYQKVSINKLHIPVTKLVLSCEEKLHFLSKQSP
jgi:hypothetical protein